MLQRTLSGGGKAYPTQTNDDILVYHCNDGFKPVVMVNSGSYGTSNYASPITASTTITNFTTPASAGGYVSINIASTAGYFAGAPIRIGGAGYYTITSVDSAIQLTCQDMAYSGNTTLGGLNPRNTLINSGATVTPVVENSPTTTTANFTQPADVNTDVTVSVASTVGFHMGCQVYISSGGYYYVLYVASATSLVLRLVSVSTNAASGTTILSGATVTANADLTIAGTDSGGSCAGPFTQAMVLRSSSSAFGLRAGGGPRLFGRKFSISCWTKYVPVGGVPGYFFGRQTVNNGANDCRLSMLDTTQTGKWSLDVSNGQGPNTSWDCQNQGRIARDSWNYLVATLDYSLTANNVKLYVNGGLAYTTSSNNTGSAWDRLFWGATTNGGGDAGTGGSWNIGGKRQTESAWTTGYLRGAIAECRLTQGVLTAQQIADIWNTANAYLL
jgi:hypothetical protein